MTGKYCCQCFLKVEKILIALLGTRRDCKCGGVFKHCEMAILYHVNFQIDTKIGILLDFFLFAHSSYRANLNANLIQDFSTTSMFSNAVRCKENKSWCFAFNAPYYHKKTDKQWNSREYNLKTSTAGRCVCLWVGWMYHSRRDRQLSWKFWFEI